MHRPQVTPPEPQHFPTVVLNQIFDTIGLIISHHPSIAFTNINNNPNHIVPAVVIWVVFVWYIDSDTITPF